jgi:CHAT domain-containing protein/Tfp pilus assembly protein PilF
MAGWKLTQHEVRMVIVSVVLWAGFWTPCRMGPVRAAELSWELKPREAGQTDQSKQGVLTLDTSGPTERTISGLEPHLYRVRLGAGQFVRIIVEQMGAEVTVNLVDPEEKVIASIASLSGKRGPVSLCAIAERAGDYLLEVRVERNAQPGRYAIRVEALRSPAAGDTDRITAERASSQGNRLYGEGTASSYRAAIQEFDRSLPLWGSIGDSYGEGLSLLMLGRAYRRLGQPEKSVDFLQQAMGRFIKTESVPMQASSFNNIAVAYGDMGELDKAMEGYEKARPLFNAVGDTDGEATALNNVGQVYALLGDSRRALGNFEQALPMFRLLGDRRRETLTLNNIGRVYDGLGEPGKALISYSQALSVAEALGDRRLRAQTLNNIGVVYSNLGEHEKALEYYRRSLPEWKDVGDARAQASTLDNIGFVLGSDGKVKDALVAYTEALGLYERAGDRIGQAVTLQDIGKAYQDSGQAPEAMANYNRALGLTREARERRGEAAVLMRLGTVYLAGGDATKALEFFNEALLIASQIGEKYIQAGALYGIADAERSLGHLKEARAQIEASLEIIEKVRRSAGSQTLRASYVASKEDTYNFYINLLMQMNSAYPGEGSDGLALQASERARARSLLDTLGQSGTDIMQGADPKLVERVNALERQLNQKAFQQNLRASEEQKRALASQITTIATDYERAQVELRAASPHIAEMVEPKPLSAREIQQGVLDAGTLLLEYSLGRQRSFLWAVTDTSIHSFVLPAGAEIDRLARHCYELLTERGKQVKFETPEERQKRLAAADRDYHDEAARLSAMLLGPAAALIGNKRLVIVSEGALEYVPFAALPDPSNLERNAGRWPLLIEGHEILSLPSASVLGVLRKEMAGRQPAPGIVAVLADPVFDNQDPRAQGPQQQEAARTGAPRKGLKTEPGTAGRDKEQRRDSQDQGGPQDTREERPARLPFTRAEAEAILGLAPRQSEFVALDFEASVKTATSPAMGRFRILHFATHGLLDSQHPELSGIVLSLVDNKGEPTDGFLRLNQIYNMKLPVDLVVLSGCKTGLGKEIKGEGLVGLTRGFMYAGAPRVVVSLWDVNDAGTAELMKLFYQAMLKKSARPAEALRAAQVAMMKRPGFSSPYYWAPFILQGEWR